MGSIATTMGFGVVGVPNTPQGRAGFAALCEYMSQETQTIIFPYHAIHYADLANALVGGRLGLAWIPPIVAIDLAARRIASVLALPVRHGATSYLTALVVARGGGIHSVAELRGKRAAWVDRESASGYVAARLYLKSVGLDVATLFAEELFLHSHGLVLDAVASGRADVAATYCRADPRPYPGQPLPDARRSLAVDVLATAGPIPNDGIAVHERVPAALRRRLLDTLAHVNVTTEGGLFRQVLQADSFCAALSSHYAALARMIEAAGRAQAPAPAPATSQKRRSNAPGRPRS